MLNTRNRGFTLIELLIVITIVAILAGVAVPSYRDYIRRGSLPEAFTYLSDYRVKLEQYYQDNRNYGALAGACGSGSTISFSPANVKYFSFSCSLNSATDNQGYTVTATGLAGTSASGHVYTLTNDGTKSTTTFKGGSVAKACWLVTGNEC